jgi:hypothetical protein
MGSFLPHRPGFPDITVYYSLIIIDLW